MIYKSFSRWLYQTWACSFLWTWILWMEVSFPTPINSDPCLLLSLKSSIWMFKVNFLFRHLRLSPWRRLPPLLLLTRRLPHATYLHLKKDSHAWVQVWVRKQWNNCLRDGTHRPRHFYSIKHFIFFEISKGSPDSTPDERFPRQDGNLQKCGSSFPPKFSLLKLVCVQHCCLGKNHDARQEHPNFGKHAW